MRRLPRPDGSVRLRARELRRLRRMARSGQSSVDVDASGEINGKKFTTPVEFRAMLAERKDDFRRAFVRKMLSYALGRGIQRLRPADARRRSCGGQDRTATDSRASLLNIAKSYPFQHARGLKGETAPLMADASETIFHPVFVPPPPPSSIRTRRRAASGEDEAAGTAAGTGRGRTGARTGAHPRSSRRRQRTRAPAQTPR